MNPARKRYLDNIRWMTVVLVVIYHVVYRHIISPSYILLFIECVGNDLICTLVSFYNSVQCYFCKVCSHNS